jgi:hypothetical protein
MSINSIWDGLYDDDSYVELLYFPIETKLYHYTDLNGLLGIIQDNSLWLSGINYLNDSDEFRNGVSTAKSILS